MAADLLPPLASLIDLREKSAIVTGAAAGIGKAIAYRLAEAGAVVHLVDMDPKTLEETAEEFRASNWLVKTHVLDVSTKAAIDAFWDGLPEDMPDILVNNAGIYPMEDFLDITEDEYNRVMNVNLASTMWMCQQFVRRREDSGGIIVNIGSIESILPFQRDLIPYGISKAGVDSLTRSLAKEYTRKGFRVNAIMPGGVKTPGASMSVKKLFKIDLSQIKDGYDFMTRLPAGRIGQPDEIARMVLVLCSDLASYVYGTLIPVDGGFLSA